MTDHELLTKFVDWLDSRGIELYQRRFLPGRGVYKVRGRDVVNRYFTYPSGDFLDLTLTDIIENFFPLEIPARLRNAIRNDLHSMTVREYLLGDGRYDALRTPNLGQKSVTDLDVLVSRARESFEGAQSSGPSSHESLMTS